MNRSLGLVIPAYNPNIDQLDSYIESIHELGFFDVIHVELDIPDGLDSNSLSAPDSINRAERRRGKGAAITSGFDFLSTDVLAFADADGATPARYLRRVIMPVAKGVVDVAIGSRRHPDAVIETHQTIYRRRLGDAFAWIARRTLPSAVYDYQCGAKAITNDAWNTIRPDIYESGFSWDLEVIAVADTLEYEIREVPITWDDTPGSTVDPIRTALNMAVALIRIRHRTKVMEGSPVHCMFQSICNKYTTSLDRSDND